MKHDFVLEPNGEIDTWQLDYDYHNGPYCRRCDEFFCHHCEPECYDEECPSNQLNERRIGATQRLDCSRERWSSSSRLEWFPYDESNEEYQRYLDTHHSSKPMTLMCRPSGKSVNRFRSPSNLLAPAGRSSRESSTLTSKILYTGKQD